MSESTSQPLAGLTVVAVEQAVAAPLCTVRLADAGARVIKIERETGDFARGYDQAAGGDSSYFAWVNHGKESLVLDIKSAEDRRLLDRILATADVFVQNLAPGVLDRIGLGSSTLREAHRDLITCDISGYGSDPSTTDKRAYDMLVQAESGLISVSGGRGELGRIGVSICDIGAGVTAHAAILEALIARATTGKGSAVEVSLFDVAAEWMTVPLIHHDYGAGAPQRQGLQHPSIAPYGAYTTDDGSLTLLSVQNEREWKKLCEEVLGLPEISSDSRFASNDRRVANREALEARLSEVILALPTQEFRRRLLDTGIAFGEVNSVADLSSHFALRLRPVQTSFGTTLRIPDHPVRRNEGKGRPTSTVPIIGADTDAIRAEFAAPGDNR